MEVLEAGQVRLNACQGDLTQFKVVNQGRVTQQFLCMQLQSLPIILISEKGVLCPIVLTSA